MQFFLATVVQSYQDVGGGRVGIDNVGRVQWNPDLQ